MKIVKLNATQFDKFAANHKYRNYFQSSMYANLMVKFGYRSQFLGIVNNSNKLIGATLLVYKNVWKKNKIAYAPRGMLCDYDDPEMLEELVYELKQTLGKQGFMLMRIDPCIPLSIRDIEGNILNFNSKGNDIIRNLEDTGFTYFGKNLYLETEKPRWETIVTLNQSTQDIYARCNKRTKSFIKKADDNGIDVTRDDTKNITKLFQFISKSDNRPLPFFKEMINNFGDSIEIYYARIKSEYYVINSRRTYEKEQEYNDLLTEQIQDVYTDPEEKQECINKKMESDKLLLTYKNNLLKATELLKQKPEGILIAGAMVIKYDNAAYIFAEGVDEQYKSTGANYYLTWKIIEEFASRKYKYVNLNAIVGDFENEVKQNPKYQELNDTKLGFNSIVTEYIGEFDLVLNSALYNKYNKQK